MFASTAQVVGFLAVALVLIGIALTVVAARLVKATRTDHAALGPLEVLGDRSWHRHDATRRANDLVKARPPGAEPATVPGPADIVPVLPIDVIPGGGTPADETHDATHDATHDIGGAAAAADEPDATTLEDQPLQPPPPPQPGPLEPAPAPPLPDPNPEPVPAPPPLPDPSPAPIPQPPPGPDPLPEPEPLPAPIPQPEPEPIPEPLPEPGPAPIPAVPMVPIVPERGSGDD